MSYGQSYLIDVMKWLEIAGKADEARKKLFVNRMQIGMDMGKPGGDTTAISILKGNKILWNDIQLNKDLDIAAYQEILIKMACAAYQVPPQILGLPIK